MKKVLSVVVAVAVAVACAGIVSAQETPAPDANAPKVEVKQPAKKAKKVKKAQKSSAAAPAVPPGHPPIGQ
jgi:uncharacterized protein YxeA